MGSTLPQVEFYQNNIISVYISLGYISIARKVFDEMPQRNVVSYNTMIGAYSRHDNVYEAWRLLPEMMSLGYVPTQFTFGSLLSCDSLDADRGFCLQAVAVKIGLLYSDAFVGTALIGLFGRHGCVNEAFLVFDEMPDKNVVTWNAMISLFGREGYVDECIMTFCQLRRTHLTLSESSFVGALSGFQSVEHLESAEQLHGLVIKFGLLCKVAIANSLVNIYGKCATTFVATKMFEMVPNKDSVSWNTIIGVLAKGDEPVKAIEFFCNMCIDGFQPNQTTFLNAISACTGLIDLSFGEFIHAKILKNNLENNILVGSSLVNLYAKHDRLDYAHRCFDEILEKNVISWNALLLGYSNRCCSTSVLLLKEMIQSGITPNKFSFSSVIKSLSTFELKEVHSLVVKMGYYLNEYVSSALMTTYAKNGLPDEALSFYDDGKMGHSVVHSNIIAGMYNKSGQYNETQELFCDVSDPDIVSWNILIAACSRNGDYKEAFELFFHMRMDCIVPDNYTYVSLVSICTKLCNLGLGSSLHGLMMKYDFKVCDVMVCNVMIDMYGKCGSLRSAVAMFDEIREKNVISWTAIVSALGLHGHGQESIEMFRQMETLGIEPDKVAFLAVLSACRHVGLVKEGMELFEKMKEKYGIEPQNEHYLIVVDLMAKNGHLKEAEKFISGMPFSPTASIWRSFFNGCNRQRTIEQLALQI